MFLLPYSTALTLTHPPKATYATAALCFLVFLLQLNFPITEKLMYFPQSWNPLTMVTASFAHGGWLHLIFNLIFFLAFTPALEAIIGSTARFIGIIVILSFVVGVCYSLWVALGLTEPLPTLGFSGVVMGFIGLSAYLMPNARIRVFWWFIVFWKTFYIRAWIVALFFIGIDAWKMFSMADFQGVNLVAHVAGGVSGYLYGMFFLAERKQEIADELEQEIESMKLVQRHGNDKGMQIRNQMRIDDELAEKRQQQAQDRLMTRVYKEVTAKHDSDAIIQLLEHLDLEQMTSPQIELLYDRVKAWGPSRTLLCLGRLLIFLLQRESNQARAIFYIQQCQAINPQFLLPDLSQTLILAQMSLYTGHTDVAKNLMVNPSKRYIKYVDIDEFKQVAQNLKLALQN
jgi:membrane associated rhomboid family serine protease